MSRGFTTGTKYRKRRSRRSVPAPCIHSFNHHQVGRAPRMHVRELGVSHYPGNAGKLESRSRRAAWGPRRLRECRIPRCNPQEGQFPGPRDPLLVRLEPGVFFYSVRGKSCLSLSLCLVVRQEFSLNSRALRSVRFISVPCVGRCAVQSFACRFRFPRRVSGPGSRAFWPTPRPCSHPLEP